MGDWLQTFVLLALLFALPIPLFFTVLTFPVRGPEWGTAVGPFVGLALGGVACIFFMLADINLFFRYLEGEVGGLYTLPILLGIAVGGILYYLATHAGNRPEIMLVGTFFWMLFSLVLCISEAGFHRPRPEPPYQ